MANRLVRLFFVAVATLAVSAQQAPTFRGSVDVVPLHVSVTNQAGRPILDLQATDFSVYDNGQRSDIAAFVRPPQTLAIKLLILDGERLPRHASAVRRGAEGVIALIQPVDRASLAYFSRWGAPFISDRGMLLEALDKALMQKQVTPFNELLHWSAFSHAREELTTSEQMRNPGWREFRETFMASRQPNNYHWSEDPGVLAMVLFSSGMDHRPPEIPLGHPVAEAMRSKNEDQSAANAVRAGVIVFGIGLDGTRDDKRLQKLSADSSGWFLQPTSKTNWTTEMARLVDDLRSRYVIGFVPTSLDGTDHKLEVKVSTPLARVRARSFYKTPSPSR